MKNNISIFCLLAILSLSCNHETNEKPNNNCLNSIDTLRWNTIIINWGDEICYCTRDSLFNSIKSYDQKGEYQSKILRKIGLSKTEQDSLYSACVTEIKNPTPVDLPRATCYGGNRVSISIRTNGPTLSVDYTNIGNDKLLPLSLWYIRNRWMISHKDTTLKQ